MLATICTLFVFIKYNVSKCYYFTYIEKYKMLQSIAATINTIGLRLIRFYLQLYTAITDIYNTISTSAYITRVIIVARHCNFLYNHESFDT